MLSAVKRAYQNALARLPLPVRRHVMYMRVHRRPLHLRKPQAFSEKVNWRIVYDRRPLLATTCDKLAMKAHAESVGDPRLRVPETYWSGTDVRELAAVTLPKRWVLKPNHLSGFVHFGEGDPDPAELARVTAPWMASEQLVNWGEWAYTQARPCLVVEELIGVPGSPPPDYKVFVFDGKPRLIQVDTARFDGHQRRLFTPDWTPLPHRSFYPLAPADLPRPGRLTDMLELAGKVGAGFDFIRVDLYAADGVIWFGEISPYPDGGIGPYDPADVDYQLGGYWTLPKL